MPKLVTFGDNVVDCYADRGIMLPGGNALNVAVLARRAGAETSYIGAVADDAAGRHIKGALACEGVATTRLRTLPGRTAFCVIGSRNGEREFLRADLGVSIIAPDAGDLSHIAGFDAVHTGRSSHVAAHLAGFASRARLSFDFAVVRDPERIARLAPHCYLASFSAGDLDEDEVADLQGLALNAGAEWCLVTRGAAGAVLAGPAGAIRTAAAHVDIVDTLGAGDSFIARVLVGLLRGEEPARAMDAAAAAAAQTCGCVGAFGHEAPMEIDVRDAVPLSEIYAAAEQGGA